jgi:hypothetical protein
MSRWIDQIWKAGQANKGNIVRRSMNSVATHASAGQLKQAVEAKGYHMAVVGDQYVIVCNPSGTIHVVC